MIEPVALLSEEAGYYSILKGHCMLLPSFRNADMLREASAIVREESEQLRASSTVMRKKSEQLRANSVVMREESERLLVDSAVLCQESQKAQAWFQVCQECYIVTICAWCRTRISVQTTPNPQDHQESHGICQACAHAFEEQAEYYQSVRHVDGGVYLDVD